MLLYLGIGVGVLLVLLVAFIASRPSDCHFERTATIHAPADAVYAVINDLHQWGRWSPYDSRDPNMKKTYEGPASGPGAMYLWDGNSQVGEGKLTILESKPGELVKMRLQMGRPFTCDNIVHFKLAPVADGTQVSWIMDGKNHFMSKATGLVINMDKMVGADFEKGLENLNRALQAAPV